MEVCGIKEAIQKLKRLELEDFGKKRKFVLKESEVAYITVLNELDKYRDRINDLINEVTIKDSELELKDQVIWFMANRLTTEYHDIDWVTNYYYEEAKNYLEKSKTENN